MLKTISAALLAVSVMAAPALAGTYGKTAHVPVTKSEMAKSKALKANARMMRHHHKHRHLHRHIGLLKTHATPKVAVKHVVPAKRG